MNSELVLAMTLVVRNEEDILPANLDFHLAQGVDVILVVDHGSTDATPEILGEYEARGRVRAFRDDERRAHDQSARVERLLAVAGDEHGADWVIHCDADEFWMPTAGSLRDVFAAIPQQVGYIVVKRSNFLAAADDGRPFYERLRVREATSHNLRGDPLEPKVAQRPAAGRHVAPGNHELIAPVMEGMADFGSVEVLHYPHRSFDQFERKVLATGIGYEQLEGREDGVGIDQLALLERQRKGELRTVYDERSVDEDAIEAGLASGVLVADARLAAVLHAHSASCRDSGDVRAVLRGAWERVIELHGELDRARARVDRARAMANAVGDERNFVAAERDELARVRAASARIEAELRGRARVQEERAAQLQRELAELSDKLAVIQNSTIMRTSAPARRLYYRVREQLRAR